MAQGCWTQENLKDNDLMNMSVFATPDTKIINLACKIEDMFIGDDSENLLLFEPTLQQLVPIADKLAQVVIDKMTDEAILNVAKELQNWIRKPRQRGRAYNIKSAALQLAQMVQIYPSGLRLQVEKEDDLPF